MTVPNLIVHLRSQSTWTLCGLGIITYGVYLAHYIQAQSNIINSTVNDNEKISLGFIHSILSIAYISSAFFIAQLFVDDGHPIAILSGLIDLAIGIMMIVWGFKARKRVNTHCKLESKSDVWFHGFWTFMFTPLYFNYKINSILEENTEPHPPEDS
jgi:sugar phosphate permease